MTVDSTIRSDLVLAVVDNDDDDDGPGGVGGGPILISDSFDTLKPVPDRPATCSRPPCLKRCASPPASSTFASNDASSENARSVSSPGSFITVSAVRSYPFSLGRGFSDTAAERAFHRSQQHVHFDAGPPESFDAHSAEDYDRSQIECTRDGSDFDLRLSSRCKRYNGEGEEEQDDSADEDADMLTSSSARSMPFGDHGSTGWAFFRPGSVIGSLSAATHNAATHNAAYGAHQNSILPSRGVRCFGGLANKGVLSRSIVADAVAGQLDRSRASLEDDDDFEDAPRIDDLGLNLSNERRNGTDTSAMVDFSAATLVSKSPDATPKPSPSIVPRWTRCTDYFAASSTATANDEQDVTPGPQGDQQLEILLPVVPETASADAITFGATSSRPQLQHTVARTPQSDVAALAKPQALLASPAVSFAPFQETAHLASSANVVMHTGSSPSIAVIDASPSQRETSPSSSAVSLPCSSLTRTQPFASPTLKASIVHDELSDQPASPCEMSEHFLGLRFAAGACESFQSLHSISSPSPISSRCSSVDPWPWTSSSCMSSSSGDSDEGCTSHQDVGIGSPLTMDVDETSGLRSPKDFISDSEASASDLHIRAPQCLTQYTNSAPDRDASIIGARAPVIHSGSMLASSASAASRGSLLSKPHCPFPVLNTAISRIQTHWMERDSSHDSSASSFASSLEADVGGLNGVEGAVHLGRSASVGTKKSKPFSGRRANSTGAQSLAVSDGGVERMRRSSSRQSSLGLPCVPTVRRKSSINETAAQAQDKSVLSASMTPDGVDAPPFAISRRKGPRSSSGNRSMRSCSASSPSIWFSCTSIEDEGALGGF